MILKLTLSIKILLRHKLFLTHRRFLFLILCISHICCHSQVTVTGIISGKNDEKISNATVILKNAITSKIITYNLSDSNGYYKIQTKFNCQPCSLEYSSFGYSKEIKTLYSTTANQKETIDVKLTDNIVSLDEVILSASKAIQFKKDTITFNAKSFTDGTETVAEDLLRKIPGISISDDGTIKIGNKEVEKVMVEGDDFFEKGYKTLTKNLPAAPIEKVELLQRYSNNKLLKGIEESDKVALNLKLNDKSKRQWFGNVDLGYGLGSENRYDARANLLNFGKKNKYYFFTNLNNVGYDATGDISNLINSSRVGEPGSIGDGERVNELVTLSNTIPYFKPSRFRFNNAELLSLNAIFNPTEKLKIKTIGFANWDELSFFRNSADTFIANGTNFTNTEDYTLKNDYVTLFGKLDLSYDMTKTENIQLISKYNDTDTGKRSDLLFNNTPTIQGLNSNNNRFDQKIAYSNKFKENKALLITGRYINEQSPQIFTVSQNNFTSLFENSNPTDNISQHSTFKFDYIGIEAHLLDRKKNGNLFEIKAGNTYRIDMLSSSFNIETEAETITPQNFQNDTRYGVNDTYLSSKYLHKFSEEWSISGTLGFHHINNTLENNGEDSSEHILIVNPSITAAWEINKRNKISFLGNLSRKNAGITDVYSNFALSGFRTASQGTGNFNQLDASSASINYTLGNWSDSFFATAFLTYSKSFDFFSTSSQINQDFSLSQRVLFKNRELFNINLSVDRYLKFLTSNLKGTFSISSINFQNIVNDSPIREITSNNYTYGLELRSGFSGIFNYHIGTKWTTNTITSAGFQTEITNNESFLDLSLILSKRFNLQFQTERYFFGNLENENSYYFADLESRYELKENKLTLSLSGKNLFNTEVFREFSLNDLGSSTTEYRLLPRYLLLKLTYRF